MNLARRIYFEATDMERAMMPPFPSSPPVEFVMWALGKVGMHHGPIFDLCSAISGAGGSPSISVPRTIKGLTATCEVMAVSGGNRVGLESSLMDIDCREICGGVLELDLGAVPPLLVLGERGSFRFELGAERNFDSDRVCMSDCQLGSMVSVIEEVDTTYFGQLWVEPAPSLSPPSSSRRIYQAKTNPGGRVAV